MNPELRVVYQGVKLAVVSVLVACAPQPTPEQTQKTQEPQLLKDPITIQVTNTPTPEQELSTTTPEPAPATATPRPDRATPIPARTVQSLIPPNTVFEADLLNQTPNNKSGGRMAIFHREGEAVISIAVKQDCRDDEPLKLAAVFITNQGEIRGLELNRRWSSIGTITGRYTEGQGRINGFVKLNQVDLKTSEGRDCPPVDMTYFAKKAGIGTESFLDSYNAIQRFVGPLGLSKPDAIKKINAACPKCNLTLEGSE